MSPYDWIVTKPARRLLPPEKPPGRPRTVCGNCGWDWVGIRKMCPACFVHPR